MNQPWGRGKQKIDSILMLKQASPVIGTGEWDDFQCRNFKGEGSKGLKEHDIILVREGADPIALCKVTGNYFSDKNLENKYHHNWYRTVEILSWYSDGESFPQPQSTLQRLRDSNTDSWKFINTFYKKTIQNNKMTGIKNLIEYKKQIILQGPPGTGKTKLAKEIAEQLIEKDSFFSDQDILHTIDINQIIKSTGGKKSYQVLEVKISERKIKIKRESETEDYTSFNEIITAYNSKLWESKLDQNNERRAASIAKFIYDKLKYKDESEQIKLIQFHPSYTYEDFVRGIVAESKGDHIEYNVINKTLGLFAEKALKNYKASSNNYSNDNLDVWIDEKFELFKNDIDAKLPEEETILSGDISVYEVSANSFKYGKNWKTASHIKFGEFKKLIKAVINKEIELSNKQMDKERFVHAHYRYTYYNALIDSFFKEYPFDGNLTTVELKKYVLIIDEINRANLSSVLGELIYALEYRGKAVSSTYGVKDDSNEEKFDIILPPNLYIIGTMNTADRSVGHVDYAIRRRFAFVDVLPKQLSDEPGIIFASTLFNSVKELFTIDNYETRSSYLSTEFEPKDVALGHSYFIDKTDEGGSMSIRLKHEIKPILLEYIKDGILKESARAVINDLGKNVIHA